MSQGRRSKSDPSAHHLADDTDDNNPTPTSAAISKRRRTVVANACEACRKRKCKCDGKRPVCSSCHHKRITCIFDSEEGLRPVQLWKVRHQRATEQAADYKELIDSLRTASDDEALALLRRLRDSEDTILDHLKQEEINDSTISSHADVQPNGHECGASSKMKIDNHEKPDEREQPPSHFAESMTLPRLPYKSYQEATQEVDAIRRQSMMHPTLQANATTGSTLPLMHAFQESVPFVAPEALARSFRNLSIPNNTIADGYSPHSNDQTQHNRRLPIHLITPMESEDRSPLSSVFTDFRRAARDMLDSGLPPAAVMGPDFVIVDLFFRNRVPSDGHTTCSWASELCKSFDGIDVFVRLAKVFFLSTYMRWMLEPSLLNYSSLPEPIRPTPKQRIIPHIPALQMAPHPAIRDAVITSFRDWLTPMSCSTTWPHSVAEAVEVHSKTGSLVLTEKFMNHVADLNNWTYGRKFLKAFPELEGVLNVMD